MPNTKSAEKALRQSKKRRVHNLNKKNSFKNTVKEFKKLLTAAKYDEAKKLLPTVYKKLDKATKAGVIQKNKASRLKSSSANLLARSAK
jgi:small subunit ribosomal protein S20